MHATRFTEAPPYEAPGHIGMLCLRLQGREAGPSEQLWLGLSIIEPGGHTGLDPSPMEKHYVVLAGELTLSNGSEEQRLGPLDSCRFAPGESRRLFNHGATEARVLLAMPLHPPATTHP